jgi:hypothetical protein
MSFACRSLRRPFIRRAAFINAQTGSLLSGLCQCQAIRNCWKSSVSATSILRATHSSHIGAGRLCSRVYDGVSHVTPTPRLTWRLRYMGALIDPDQIVFSGGPAAANCGVFVFGVRRTSQFNEMICTHRLLAFDYLWTVEEIVNHHTDPFSRPRWAWVDGIQARARPQGGDSSHLRRRLWANAQILGFNRAQPG